MRTNRLLSALAMAVSTLAFAIAATPSRAADDRGIVKGVVSDDKGQPVVGAFVKLKNVQKRLTILVISQPGGAFTAGDLPAGQWTVQGVGGNFQSDVSAPVAVAAGATASQNISLAKARGPLLPPAWPKRIPEAEQDKLPKDLPPGPHRELVEARCSVCHTVDRIIAYRPERPEWEHTLARMRMRIVSAGQPDVTEAEKNQIVDYLTTAMPPIQPYDPNSRLPTKLLEGKALKYRMVIYDLPDDFDEPHDVALDPQGNAWIAEHVGMRLGRFDPRTLEWSQRPLPAGTAPPNRQGLGNAQIDPRGVLWVTDGPNARWISYDTKTDTPTIFAWPKVLAGGAGANSMAVAPSGKIYATGANRSIREFDPATGQFRSYDSPSANGKQLPGAYGVAVDGDGAVWWAEDAADKMARLDPKTEKVEEYKIPFDGRAFPRRMNVDANGDIWVGLWMAGRLMKIDHKTREMKIFTPPSQSGGNYSVVVDKKQNFVWVSEHQVDKIARFDPKTEEWTEYPLPDAESDPRRVEIDPTNPNRVFYSGDTAGRLGFIEVLP